MTNDPQAGSARSRREFVTAGGVNLASLALWSLMEKAADAGSPGDHSASAGFIDPLSPTPSHYRPKAKSVIFLFMVGGPSHLDLFDPKAELNRREGESLPAEILNVAKFAQIQEKQPKLMASRWKFARHGECGASVSELLPETASIVDKISFLRTLKTDDTNHAFAELMMNTGWRNFGRPSMGSWATYGLGSAADNLPAFMVLQSGMWPRSKSANYGNGFLPSAFQGVPLRSSGSPILNLENPAGFDRQRQRRTIDAVNRLNAERFADTLDPETTARIAAYERAFRMQAGATELFDLGAETPAALAQYGIDNPNQPSYARNCLLARRLVERGVRFVQVFHGDWDHHTNIGQRLPHQCRQTDRASAALVQDLQQRGLLDETLVIWGGELGRSSVAQISSKDAVGRDHHIEAFTMWLAGGGVRAGHSVGKTDELGYFAVEDPCHVHDLQATILHLLGLDHTRLTYRFQGRDFRLTDVHGEVIEPLLA